MGISLVAVAAWWARPVRADGDPASDVLVTQSLFLPQDARVPPRQQLQLGSLLAAARRGGYPLRVAIIASPADLGSVTALWNQPQAYARFLGQELSLVHRGPLLVVMPQGFGLSGPGGRAPAGSPGLVGLPSPGSASGLGGVTLLAIGRVAAAAGHPVTAPSAPRPPAPGSSDAVPWIVFAGGAALIAVAWGFSLRARPLQLRRRSDGSA